MEGSPSTAAATATFGADGRYQLSTFGTGDGAVLGTHRVIVQAVADVESDYGEETVLPQSAIPLLYADSNKSGLTAEVHSGDNPIDFELK